MGNMGSAHPLVEVNVSFKFEGNSSISKGVIERTRIGDGRTDGPTDATKRIQYSPPHILWWGYNKCTKNQSKGNHLKERQKMLYKINQRGIIQKWNKVQFLCAALKLLPETCIPSMESFKPLVTKLCSGQEMLYKINQREIIIKWNKVELQFLCTALQVIARNMHTKYGVIQNLW